MKYRHAYCYDSTGLDFDAPATVTNAYIEEVMTWKEVRKVPNLEAVDSRMSVLDQDLQRTIPRVVIFAILLSLSSAANHFTRYWVIPFAIFLPLMLRYSAHYLTLKIAINRANQARWHAEN